MTHPAEKDLLPCCRGEGPCQAPPDIGPCDPLPSAEKDVPPPDIRPGDYIVRPGIGSQVDAYVESVLPPAKCSECGHALPHHERWGCMAEVGDGGSGSVADAVFCKCVTPPARGDGS